MGKKNKKGAGNTTLTDRINALPFANKVSGIKASSCHCLRDESSVECLQRVSEGCCRKIDIHVLLMKIILYLYMSGD